MAVTASLGLGAAGQSDPDEGKAACSESGCNRCHPVETQNIEATISVERLRSPDLSHIGSERDTDWIVGWVKREQTVDDNRIQHSIAGATTICGPWRPGSPTAVAASMSPGLLAVIAVTAVNLTLMLILVRRPALLGVAGGSVLAFLAILVMPVAAFSVGLREHVEKSKQTDLCVSCHVMEPYGCSLLLDSAGHLLAQHFQNARVGTEFACFGSRTKYTIFGDLQAKVTGIKHVWASYLGTILDELTLYQPYRNRECLYEHGEAVSSTKAFTLRCVRSSIRTRSPVSSVTPWSMTSTSWVLSMCGMVNSDCRRRSRDGDAPGARRPTLDERAPHRCRTTGSARVVHLESPVRIFPLLARGLRAAGSRNRRVRCRGDQGKNLVGSDRVAFLVGLRPAGQGRERRSAMKRKVHTYEADELSSHANLTARAARQSLLGMHVRHTSASADADTERTGDHRPNARSSSTRRLPWPG